MLTDVLLIHVSSHAVTLRLLFAYVTFFSATRYWSKKASCAAVLDVAFEVALDVWLMLFVVVQPAKVQKTRTSTITAANFLA